MSIDIKLVGRYGLAGLLLIIGYLFYEKSIPISLILLVFGLALIIILIVSDIQYRHNKWRFG
jgi:membrane protein YdbS with pleckstrin-like domain